MVSAARRALFQCEAEQNGGVVSVHGGPASRAVADVHDGALLAVGGDEHVHESPVLGAVDGGREAHDGAADLLLLGYRVEEIGGQRAVGHGNVADRGRVLGREFSLGETQGAGRDDEGLSGAGEHFGHCADGIPVGGAGAGEVGEVVDEGEVNYAVGGLGAAAEALEVFEVAFVGFGAGGGEGGDVGFAAGEAEDLVAIFEEFVDGGAADEAGGAGDEDAHSGFGETCLSKDVFERRWEDELVIGKESWMSYSLVPLHVLRDLGFQT